MEETYNYAKISAEMKKELTGELPITYDLDRLRASKKKMARFRSQVEDKVSSVNAVLADIELLLANLYSGDVFIDDKRTVRIRFENGQEFAVSVTETTDK